MKNSILILAFSLTIGSCSNNIQKKSTQDSLEISPKAIGGGKDKNGCLTGAGQTWSQLKKTCIQVFNEALRLNPISTPNDQAVISSFVLMNEDKTLCEIFLPSGDVSSIILKRSSDKNYVEGDYRYDAENTILYIKDTAVYKAK